MMSSLRRTRASGLVFFREYPIAAYFVLTFAISWFGALAVVLPEIIRGQEVSKIMGIVMLPAMLLGPALAGIVITRLAYGTTGLKDLFHRMRALRVGGGWYAVLLVPPFLVLATLSLLSRLLSPAFGPNHFYLGILFGIPAGFFEEIGWTGFALPKMHSRFGILRSAIVLGVIWGAWHLPVISYLGAAAPHGPYWLAFFLVFTFAMTAMRVLIAWLYVNTGSILLAQLMHVSSTGALVIFSPQVSPAQEAMWYGFYGLSLWIVVGVLAALGQFKGRPPKYAGRC
jgi:uncharacterized protein